MEWIVAPENEGIKELLEQDAGMWLCGCGSVCYAL